jgi:hypothetical protein
MIEVLFILQNFSVIIGRQKYIFFGLLLMHRVIGYTSFHSVFKRHYIPYSVPGLAIAHPGLTRVGLAALLEGVLNIFAKMREFCG